MGKLATLSGVEIERVAFGTEQLGGYDWGAIDLEAIELAVDFAVNNGCFLFDTADCYGKGESEKRLGKALCNSRSNAFIATKFGVRFDEHGSVFYDNSPDYCERALDSSLERLNTDYIDLYLVHWPDRKTPLHRLFEKLESCREDGRIRCYGVSNFSLDKIDNLAGYWPGFKFFSMGFNLLNCNEKLRINDICLNKGLIFLAYGVLAQGLLSGKYSEKSTFDTCDRRSRGTSENFKGEKYLENLKLVYKLRHLAQKHPPWSVAQLAIKFVLEELPHSCSVVGVKGRQQFTENIEPSTCPIGSDLLEQVRCISQLTQVATV
ncbi:MAG: hypothetical protein CMI26_01455 [Opitutae bacterium]|nr:hypothetical protein [Opitutae bacterium]|tara:strand:- start:453 stop:1412 length:960 start_codon:yes stop_codon:yes gene_type:complete